MGWPSFPPTASQRHETTDTLVDSNASRNLAVAAVVSEYQWHLTTHRGTNHTFAHEPKTTSSRHAISEERAPSLTPRHNHHARHDQVQGTWSVTRDQMEEE
jgi:hypothetical protein